MYVSHLSGGLADEASARYGVLNVEVGGHEARAVAALLVLRVLRVPLEGRPAVVLVVDLPRYYVHALVVVLVLRLYDRRLLPRMHKLVVCS